MPVSFSMLRRSDPFRAHRASATISRRIRSVRNHDELTAIPKRASDVILTGQRDLPISGAEVVRYAFGTYLRQLWASLSQAPRGPSGSTSARFCPNFGVS